MTDDRQRARDEHVMASFAIVLTAGFHVINPSRALFILPDDEGYIVRRGEVLDGQPGFADERFEDVRSAIGYYLDACEDVGDLNRAPEIG